ncbi:hypothetical protein [Sphingomonas sp. Root710]|uniref:hypothetical protein n=1 Tax=Sphingomonas sp. Root710 TaxID=1736594 RepID=UPI0009E83FF2|nr:hypothetical protein [Sphingomonas sp. Root710]
MKYLVGAALLAVLCAPATAQESSAWVVGGAPSTVLRSGTPISLRTTSELTTKGKHLKVGDRFTLEVGEAVLLNGRVVIPIGSPAVGEVTSIRNKGMWGKSGNIETRLLYVTANDRRLRISGSVNDKGKKNGGGAIATSAIVFLPAGFFMTGTSALIPPGTVVNAILEEDVPVIFADQTPAAPAMTIPAPAVAPQPAGGAVIPANASTASAQQW